MHKIVGRLATGLIALLAAVGLLAATPALASANAKGGWKGDKVYVVDHTGSLWRVGTGAEVMDDGSPLDLVYRTKCPTPSSRCIDVYSPKKVSGSAVGLTKTTVSNGYIVDAKVYLENDWGKKASQAQRDAVIRHELGHAVGLGHTSRKTSIMHNPPAVIKPDKKDLSKLNKLY